MESYYISRPSPSDDQLQASETELGELDVDIDSLRADLASLPTPPLTGWFLLSNVKQSAVDIVRHGWAFEEFERIFVTRGPNWARYGALNRSWGYNLHAWRFMQPLLKEHSASGASDWLAAALSPALDWIDTYITARPPEDPMAWYDMSLAMRTPMLLNLLIRVARNDAHSECLPVLTRAMIHHLDVLNSEESFNVNSNHGFYVAIAQVHVSRLVPFFPGARKAGEAGLVRLRRIVEKQFSVDGIHLEHSPDYHRMLLGSFEAAIDDGLVDDSEILRRISRAASALGWMIKPDGHLVQFGDSPSTRMTIRGAHSSDPNTQFIISSGQSGQPTSEQSVTYPAGGYFFVRSPPPQVAGDVPKSSYLAFSAAFHSRTHKHADDLNLVWSDLGCEILVDSGRFGYGELLPADSPLRKSGFYYSSRERQYVESTVAHNTLSIDNLDQQRWRRKPFGSGIVNTKEHLGVFEAIGRVVYGDYVHRRRVVFRPGKQLVLRDAVYSKKSGPRIGRLWFNISDSFCVVEEASSLVFVNSAFQRPVRLDVSGPGDLISPVRGQQEPMRGWRSRTDRCLEPIWSFGFEFMFTTRRSVETTFTLSLA